MVRVEFKLAQAQKLYARNIGNMKITDLNGVMDILL
jgi:hypothetical protein